MDILKPSAKDVIGSRLSDLPQPVLLRIREGYAELSRADKGKASDLVSSLAKQITSGQQPARSDVSSALGLTDRAAESVLLSISVTVAMLLDIDATAEDYLALARDKTFLDDGSDGAALVANSITEGKKHLLDRAEQSFVSNALLPSFQRADVEVDIRVRFKDEGLERAVPIALVFIDTDIDSQRVFFQIREADLEALIDKLGSALKSLKKAQDLVGGLG